MSVESLLKYLTEDPYYRQRVAYTEIIPARQPLYGKLKEDLPDSIKAYLRGNKLYTHQCQAIESMRDSKNVIIATPTASGKSLAFNIPVFEHLACHTKSTALYLYPTKALSNDQLGSIREMEKATKIRVNPDIYDGDTPSGRKARIREKSRIIISNPHELHYVLPWHYKWQQFLGNLQFVVIDEAHTYRGVFGSNVAYLLRRLRRICDYYGSKPQFILSSATIANPLELAEKLIGCEFELISDNGAPNGEKVFMLYNPYFNDDRDASIHQETKKLIIEFAKHDLHAICFTISRKMAELLAMWSKGEITGADQLNPDRIATYRAGYLPAERRDIESRLKRGDLNVVVSTNALELGIDVGELDGVIISGYPGTVTSLWQQAGRSGRGEDKSIAVLVAFLNPLDQFFMNHPHVIFERPYEHAIIDLKNKYILSGQLLCAAAEAPISIESDAQYFSQDFKKYIDSFEKEMILSKTASGYVYSDNISPVEKVTLDAVSSELFTIVCDGKLLETIDVNHAYRDAHKGAVLLHQGETYIVDDLDLDSRISHVRKSRVDYYTESLKLVNVEIKEEYKRKAYGDFSIMMGGLNVSERYAAYNVKKYDTVLKTVPLDLPAINFNTVGFWFTIPSRVKRDILDRKLNFAGGLHGVEHGMIGVMPFQVMCDRWDIGGVSMPNNPDTLAPTIFIYDGFDGGIGLSEKAFELFEELAGLTHELIRDCKCENGCPGCIYSPKCGNGNRPLDKNAATFILKALLDEMRVGSGR